MTHQQRGRDFRSGNISVIKEKKRKEKEDPIYLNHKRLRSGLKNIDGHTHRDI